MFYLFNFVKPKLSRLAAKAGHLSMYISIGAIAVTGLMIGALYYVGIHAGLITDAVIGLHDLAINASYVIIVLHIATALYHRYLADGIWSSMAPFFKEK